MSPPLDDHPWSSHPPNKTANGGFLLPIIFYFSPHSTITHNRLARVLCLPSLIPGQSTSIWGGVGYRPMQDIIGSIKRVSEYVFVNKRTKTPIRLSEEDDACSLQKSRGKAIHVSRFETLYRFILG